MVFNNQSVESFVGRIHVFLYFFETAIYTCVKTIEYQHQNSERVLIEHEPQEKRRNFPITNPIGSVGRTVYLPA